MNQNVAILNRPLKKYMMEFIKTFKEYKIKKQFMNASSGNQCTIHSGQLLDMKYIKKQIILTNRNCLLMHIACFK